MQNKKNCPKRMCRFTTKYPKLAKIGKLLAPFLLNKCVGLKKVHHHWCWQCWLLSAMSLVELHSILVQLGSIMIQLNSIFGLFWFKLVQFWLKLFQLWLCLVWLWFNLVKFWFNFFILKTCYARYLAAVWSRGWMGGFNQNQGHNVWELWNLIHPDIGLSPGFLKHLHFLYCKTYRIFL